MFVDSSEKLLAKGACVSPSFLETVRSPRVARVGECLLSKTKTLLVYHTF